MNKQQCAPFQVQEVEGEIFPEACECRVPAASRVCPETRACERQTKAVHADSFLWVVGVKCDELRSCQLKLETPLQLTLEVPVNLNDQKIFLNNNQGPDQRARLIALARWMASSHVEENSFRVGRFTVYQGLPHT